MQKCNANVKANAYVSVPDALKPASVPVGHLLEALEETIRQDGDEEDVLNGSCKSPGLCHAVTVRAELALGLFWLQLQTLLLPGRALCSFSGFNSPACHTVAALNYYRSSESTAKKARLIVGERVPNILGDTPAVHKRRRLKAKALSN